MIKNYPLILIAFLCFSLSGFGQTTQGWENASYNHSSSNSNYTFGDWTVNNGRLYGSDKQRSGNYAANIDDDSGGEIIYNGTDGGGKDNGVGSVSLWYKHWDGDNNSVKFKMQYNQNNFGWVDFGTEVVVTSETYTEFSYDLNLSGDNIRIRLLSTAYDERLMIDDFEITDYAVSGPTITATPTTITGLDYTTGNGPSTAQSFTVTGTLLTEEINVAVTINQGFEISLSAAGPYGDDVTIPQASANGTTTIYVRLKEGLVGSFSSIATISSTGATDAVVNLEGEVINAPSNDNCSGAISLTPTSTCNFTSYTNVNATDSGIGSPSCSSYGGEDVWFSVIVPASGELTIDTQNIDFTDSGMEIYSGSCGSLVSIECDDDDSANGFMSLISRNDFTPGDTIYIRIWQYSGYIVGDFGICVSTPTPCAAPSTQPTGLVLNNITGSTIDGSFTATTADDYLVVASTSPTLGANPVNGTSYSNGDPLGSGTVVQSSNTTTFTATGLSQTTQYYFFVFALNDSSCSGGPTYNTTSPLTDTATTISGPCLTTGFENADGWSDHGYGNWTNTDSNGEIWSGNGIYAGNPDRRIQMNDIGDWLELPPVDNPSSLEYYGSISSSATGNNRIMVQYFDGSYWVDIIEHTSTSTSYELFTADLSGITALTNVRLRLRRSADSRTHYIDDLSVYCGSSSPNAELQLVDNTATNQDCGFTLDFGDVSIGSTSDLTFDIENIGTLDLNISNLAITGDYTIVSPASTPFTIPAGDSETVTLRFTPLSDETLIGELTITSDDADEGTCTVNLIGEGFTPQPDINVEGNLAGFPDIPGDGSNIPIGVNHTLFASQLISEFQDKSFRIVNTGSLTLNISDIVIGGDNPGDFTITGTAPNFTIAPNGIEILEIRFSPLALGIRNATVEITSNDSDENPFIFNIQGTGDGSEINVKGNNINIPNGNVNISTSNYTNIGNSNINPITPTTASKIFEIENLGNLPLDISSITITGIDATDFTVSPTLLSVAAGSTEFITITFNPTTLGVKNAIVSIANNDSTNNENPYTFSIQGNALNYTECASGDSEIIVIQDFDSTTPTWGYSLGSLNFFDFGGSSSDGFWGLTTNSGGIALANQIDYLPIEDNFLFLQDLKCESGDGCSNTTGEGVLTFDSVNISTKINVTFSFDYQVYEFDSPDYVYYQLFYDNVPQPEVTLVNNSGNFSTEGTVNIDIPDSVNNFYFELRIIQNGSDSAGFDNFKLTNSVAQEKTWDGVAWSGDGLPPTSTQKAILNGDYVTANDGGSFTSCECEINSGAVLTISDNTFVEVQNNLIVNGEDSAINIEPQGSFIQINDFGNVTATTPTNLTVSKRTAPANNWYEYTYWSSPVFEETPASAFANAHPARRYQYNAEYYRDSTYETANDGTTTNGAGVDDIDDNWDDWGNISTTYLVPGVGYATTHDPSTFSSTLGCPGPTCRIQYTFSGLFNNGIIEVPLYRNDEELNDNNWNFVGNPYPSAISADVFLATNMGLIDEAIPEPNPIINGAIYLWSQSTPPSDTENGNENLNFSQSDYAIINGTGETAAQSSGGDSTVPSRFIPSGQGFFISMSDAATSTQVTPSPISDEDIQTVDLIFNNAMRVTSNNNQFFRNASQNNSDNKLWINLSSDNGVFNQALIGYLNHATDAYDGMYFDAPRNASTDINAVIYTLIPDVEKVFAIQGKNTNSLNLEETIPLGFDTSINVATIYSLSLAQFEGAFMSENAIYIKDNLLNTTHNLKSSDYTFTSEPGEFNERFEIVFETNALSIDENLLNANDLTITELQNGHVEFKVGSAYTIKHVAIIDVTGRLIYNLSGNNATEVYDLSRLSQAAYVAKITLSNGQVISKKAIKQR
ncbi:choice-of-anchor D domain-containing protein [Winogradskyella vidalii]|uniref:choice-of-anchor D domain-containing protein n=1 Tax=Winogradskyella vidalii TaxID=2615024 RepID=UPI0015C71F84|nr:choice-of-anchor D domain-containing protein [Winogradskyella vidalii]